MASNYPMLSAALRIVDDAWQELQRGLWVKAQLGAPVARLPSLSPDEAERRAAVGRELLARIGKLDLGALPDDIELTVALARHRATTWAREGDWYWTVIDPLSVGFFGMFLPTAYCGAFFLNNIHGLFKAHRFADVGDLDRYLALVADYARLVRQFAARTKGQADRGMRMPRVQVVQARSLMQALRARSGATLAVSADRLGGLPGHAFQRDLAARLTGDVDPAFDQVLQVLSDDYLMKAPHEVGLSQYPKGQEVYEELVKQHTTLDLTPEHVHARGLEGMAAIEAQKKLIQEEVGVADEDAFMTRLRSDPRFRAGTVDEVRGFFQRYIDRIQPCLAQLFHRGPTTACDVAPLPEALQASMTFGYYDAPRADRRTGIYLFNAANLTRQPLFNLGALTYHELVPGHHLHLSLQQANQSLHPFRAFSFFNAYNEGWAEYAATLAGEVGMYQTPEERYGRLVMDAFLTCRLVVDTGMNALGWPLERAREYMRKYSGMPEGEICSETIRYSCDIPGQSLAYKLGDAEFLRLRERMRVALGTAFDIRDFHAAVLSPGALPLPELAAHVGREIARMGGECEPALPRARY